MHLEALFLFVLSQFNTRHLLFISLFSLNITNHNIIKPFSEFSHACKFSSFCLFCIGDERTSDLSKLRKIKQLFGKDFTFSIQLALVLNAVFCKQFECYAIKHKLLRQLNHICINMLLKSANFRLKYRVLENLFQWPVTNFYQCYIFKTVIFQIAKCVFSVK